MHKTAYLNQAQSAALQSYCTETTADKPSGLEAVHNRIRASVAGADLLMDRLTVLEGRLLGGGGNPGKEASTRPQPCGHIGAMNSTLDDLSERLERCTQIISRLSDAI